MQSKVKTRKKNKNNNNNNNQSAHQLLADHQMT